MRIRLASNPSRIHARPGSNVDPLRLDLNFFECAAARTPPLPASRRCTDTNTDHFIGGEKSTDTDTTTRRIITNTNTRITCTITSTLASSDRSQTITRGKLRPATISPRDFLSDTITMYTTNSTTTGSAPMPMMEYARDRLAPNRSRLRPAVAGLHPHDESSKHTIEERRASSSSGMSSSAGCRIPASPTFSERNFHTTKLGEPRRNSSTECSRR
jgi:hypothetical protein